MLELSGMGDFSLAQLQALGIAVARQPGRITSRQKCGVCGAKGKFTLRAFGDGPGQVRMLFCSECGRFPRHRAGDRGLVAGPNPPDHP